MNMGNEDVLQWVAGQWAGCFRLVSAELALPDGGVYFPFGKRPVGTVIFSDVRVDREQGQVVGSFFAQLMHEERTGFAGDFPTAEEALQAYAGYVAYYGAFTIDGRLLEAERDAGGNIAEVSGRLVNHVRAALNPNWVGGDQTRQFELSENRAVLSVVPGPDGDGAPPVVLAWEREG